MLPLFLPNCSSCRPTCSLTFSFPTYYFTCSSSIYSFTYLPLSALSVPVLPLSAFYKLLLDLLCLSSICPLSLFLYLLFPLHRAILLLRYQILIQVPSTPSPTYTCTSLLSSSSTIALATTIGSLFTSSPDWSSKCTTLDWNGACYWLGNTQLTWTEAYMDCVRNQGTLVVADSTNVDGFLIGEGLFLSAVRDVT